MSSLPQAEAGLVSVRSAPQSLRYLPHVLVATAVVSVVPIAIVWALRVRGVVSSRWIALPLAVALSLLAAAVGSAWWTRRRRAQDLMFSELLLWGWLRRLYVDHQVERAVGLLRLAHPVDHSSNGHMTVERRRKLLSELAWALEAQDPYLEGHSRRVARHATMIARRIGLSADEVAKMRVAAALHDVGKLHVPQGLLNKPGTLSATEFDQVKPHADEGAKMVASLGDDQLTSIVRHHHERLDGTGYPDGLRGSSIPLGARIIAVADTYDAITAARPYRRAAPHKQAFDTLREESLTHLDPALVRAFRSCYSGRGPLAFWESFVAWVTAVHVFAPRTPAIARRLSLRELVATTVTTTAVAVAAVAAPIGVRGGQRHSVAPPPVTLTRASIQRSTLGHARPRPAPVHARRSAPAVVHHVAHSTSVLPAPPHLTQAPTTRRGPHPAIRHSRSTPHTTAPAAPSTHLPIPHPPTTAAQQPPPKPRPRPVVPIPAATTPVAPAQTTPATPSTGTAVTTTPPTPPPVTSTAARPPNKDACKNGGYARYGYSNQGQCVAAAEHGG